MAEKPRGMGRGLAAILSASPVPEPSDELRDLPVELIAPNPNQPRRAFDDAALAGLATSVEERGVLQPVLVRPVPGGSYELIAGERRWRAAQIAGLPTVPAIVRPHDDAMSLEIALIENMVREDLNPVEEARALRGTRRGAGLTREDRRPPRRPAAASRCPTSCGCSTCPTRCSTDREGPALRGSRPRAADDQGPRRAQAPGARGGRSQLVGARARGPRARGGQAHDEAPAPHARHRDAAPRPRPRAGADRGGALVGARRRGARSPARRGLPDRARHRLAGGRARAGGAARRAGSRPRWRTIAS